MKGVIKQLLKEQLFNKNSKEQIDLLNKFVLFTCKYLDIKDTDATVKLKFNRDDLTTTASYQNKKIIVFAEERALVDIMRSIGHELTHMKQDISGKLTGSQDGISGSPIENESNATAGILIRKFGEIHPEIYS